MVAFRVAVHRGPRREGGGRVMNTLRSQLRRERREELQADRDRRRMIATPKIRKPRKAG